MEHTLFWLRPAAALWSLLEVVDEGSVRPSPASAPYGSDYRGQCSPGGAVGGGGGEQSGELAVPAASRQPQRSGTYRHAVGHTCRWSHP